MQDTTATQSAIDITFDNRGDRLIGLGLVNGLLKIVSLGLYAFWGKTEVRKRLWSFTRLNGEPLEYTGTGKELFLGFLVVFFAFVLPLMIGGFLVAYFFPGQRGAIAIYQFAAYALFFFLLGNALYRAQRYRLSRTRWRGIRAGLEGSPATYGWTYFWTLVAPFALVAGLAGAVAAAGSPPLAGGIGALGFIAALWVLPWRSNKLQAMITNDMRFGDRALSYSGTARPLYKRYFFAWAGSALLYVAAAVASAYYAYTSGLITMVEERIPPTGEQVGAFAAIWIGVLIAIGLITAWYRANQMNHFAGHTHLDAATFKLNASGKSLMWLLFSNWMLSALGVLAGIALGGFAAYGAGLWPEPPEPGMEAADPGVLPVIIMLVPIVITTTLATTFAQFRSARYFLSRLKLDGAVDLGAILQSQSSGPKRGEGLAQVFDLDAF
jgi:uncharacterized membrane protein YjgN (DUF898 family)